MSWSEIKKAVNSTVGTPNFRPLDVIIKDMLTPTMKLEINANGNYDVKSYGSVSVNVREEKLKAIAARAAVEITAEDLDGITQLGDAAFFAGNFAGGTIELPDSVFQIKDQCFAYSNLKHIRIGDNVKTIGNNAFANNSLLEEVYLGSGITSIGTGCFLDCAKLQKITCAATTPPTLGSDVFKNVPQYIDVYVPYQSYETYLHNSIWTIWHFMFSPIASFRINNTKYDTVYYGDGSEANYSWNDWVQSDFNINKKFYIMDGRIFEAQSGSPVLRYNGSSVNATDIIEPNEVYLCKEQAEPQTITFTIDGITYYAGKNMSFDEWVTTEYNTAGFESVNGQIVKGDRVLDVADITAYIVNGRAYVTIGI